MTRRIYLRCVVSKVPLDGSCFKLEDLQLEQDFEQATQEYEYINNALKVDLPRFMQLSTQFIDPLFNSFFYMTYGFSDLPSRSDDKQSSGSIFTT